MKILITRNASDVMDYTAGSYNLQEIGLARALNKKGHQCDVVYSGGKTEKTLEIEYEKGKTFKLIYLKTIKILDNGYLLGLDDIIKDYDVIHSGAYDQIRTWMFAKRYPDKLVVYQGPYASEYTKNYNKKCAVVDRLFLSRYKKYKTTFITKSQLSAEFLKQKGLEDVTPIGVGFDLAQMGSDAEKFEPMYTEILKKKELGKKQILYVGRIEDRRNILFMLESLKQYIEQYPSESVNFIIVGKGNKDYEDKCRQFISENHLDDYISWVDRIEQKYLPAIYKLVDLFWLPTKFEIFGMVLLEAMYYGVPVISTFNGGSSILINHGINGIICDDNVARWVNYTHEVLSTPNKFGMLSQNAHRTIAECFTWDALADRFVEVYSRKANSK